MIKFPYGISDFRAIISDSYFYIDRSDRISLLEEAGKQLLFLRPRRFGKSMLLSLLENYYDLARADEFEQLFRHLSIGKQPTPLHNCYFVMTWDFSVIVTSLSTEEMQQSVHDHINSQTDRFAAVQAQLAQARTQLQTYRRDLTAAYQGHLRLQTYAIVALGFDRLVCEEVTA